MIQEKNPGSANTPSRQALNFWTAALEISSGLRDIEQAVPNSADFKKMYDLARFIPVHLSRLISSHSREEQILHLENTKHLCVLLLCRINGLINLRSTCLMKKKELNSKIYTLIKEATVYCNNIEPGLKNKEKTKAENVQEAIST